MDLYSFSLRLPLFLGISAYSLHPDRIFAGDVPNCESYPLKVWGTGDGGNTWQESVVEVQDGGEIVCTLVLDRRL